MTTVAEIFELAMSLMDELNSAGTARTNDTLEYEHRTPSIINTLIAEKKMLEGAHGMFVHVESMDDDIIEADDTYCVGVMQYGLAAKLLLDENPTAASFYHQKYEEQRALYFSRAQAEADEDIIDLYGGIEHGQFARW